MQSALLVYLRKNTGRLLSRDELAAAVWGFQLDARSRVIDQTISQVRKQLSPSEKIRTVHGKGYVYTQSEPKK